MIFIHFFFRFASYAKNIKNKPIVNEVCTDAALLKKYSKEIRKLKEDLEREKASNRSEELLELAQKNEDLVQKIRQLNEKLITTDVAGASAESKIRKIRRQTWAAPKVRSVKN